MLNKLRPKSEFARHVITLMTGTSIAQAIPIAISPILTRLYTPEDFGVFALYMAVASIISVLVTGRYELAIMLPKKDSDAINIVALSAGLSCAISGILLLIIIIFNSQITRLLGAPAVSNWLYFVPVTTLLTGIYQSLNYWSNRKSHYKRMAISRILQNGGTSLGQLGSGYAPVGGAGLVGGQLVGQALSTAVLARQIYCEDKEFIKKIKNLRVFVLAKKYSKFPKYLIAAHGFNTGSSQMPIILLNTLFSSTVAGFYSLTQRVFGAPMSLVAGAIGDVFRQRASHAYVHQGSCRVIYEESFRKLLVIAVLPFSIFFFVAPSLFEVIFGEPWKESGRYAQILTPMIFLRFVTSPLSAMFIIAQKQIYDLVWQVILFTFVVGALYFGYLSASLNIALIAFSVAYSIMYFANGVISYRLSFGGNHVQ